MLSLITKHKVKAIMAIVSIICLFGFVPLLINHLYKTPAPVKLFQMKWEASDALSFYGSVLGFLGSFLLGAVSVFQNKQLHNEMREREEKYHWEEKELLYRPQFYLYDVTTPCGDSQRDIHGIWEIKIPLPVPEGSSEIAKLTLKVTNGRYIHDYHDYGKLYYYDQIPQIPFYKAGENIPVDGSLSIILNEEQCSQDGILHFVFVCKNELNIKYRQIIPFNIQRTPQYISIRIHELGPVHLCEK